MPGAMLRGPVAAVPGPPELAALHKRAMPQKDGLCGPFWGALVLSAFGHPTEAESVAMRAGTILAEGDDPTRWLPPGASPRTDYLVPLPTTRDGTLAGTPATGLARAVEELSGGKIGILPLVAGRWTADAIIGLIEVAFATAPDCVLVANGRTGCLWDSRPDPNLLLGYLLGGAGGASDPDWDVGHFFQLVAAARGPGGALVVLRDTYPTLGWAGHHLQPAGAVAAALERNDGAEGGVLLVCPISEAGRLRGCLEAAGFGLRHWDNGTPDSGPRGV
jgi:hypothetical protein